MERKEKEFQTSKLERNGNENKKGGKKIDIKEDINNEKNQIIISTELYFGYNGKSYHIRSSELAKLRSRAYRTIAIRNNC